MSAEVLPSPPDSAQNGGTIANQPGGSGGASALIIGDGNLHPGKGNMALVRRAVRDGWPVAPEVRQAVVTQMAAVVNGSDDERNRIAASKVLVAASSVNTALERLDQADAHALLPKVGMHLHQHQPADPNQKSHLLGICDRLGIEPPAFLTDQPEPLPPLPEAERVARISRVAAMLGIPDPTQNASPTESTE